MSTPRHFTIKGSTTQRVLASARSSESLLAEADRLGASRIFLLAGRTLTETTPHVRALETALAARHAGTFTAMRPHTPLEDVVKFVAEARAAKADLIVTVGGGAQTDAGKIATLALKAGVRDLNDLLALSGQCGWDKAGRNDPGLTPDVPVICIPTTLSGGEFNEGSGASDQQGHKLPFIHRHAAPIAIILDPWITLDTPEWLWLSTGMRAIDHAVEALASLRSNPFCDAMAQSALRLLAPALRRVKYAPEDVEARSSCQIGGWLAMLPIVSGVPMGASHAIGHALGAKCHVPHGHTSCILMPVVQRWNAEAAPERHALIAEALGVPEAPVGDLLAQLVDDLGQPGSLGEVGVADDPELFRQIAELALPAPWTASNPRPVRSTDDIVAILQAASKAFDRSSQVPESTKSLG